MIAFNLKRGITGSITIVIAYSFALNRSSPP